MSSLSPPRGDARITCSRQTQPPPRADLCGNTTVGRKARCRQHRRPFPRSLSRLVGEGQPVVRAKRFQHEAEVRRASKTQQALDTAGIVQPPEYLSAADSHAVSTARARRENVVRRRRRLHVSAPRTRTGWLGPTAQKFQSQGLTTVERHDMRSGRASGAIRKCA